MVDLTLPDVRPGDQVPRRIFQTYPGSLPAPLAANVARLRDMNPDWEHHLLDDGDIAAFIADHYSRDILRVYRSISAEYGAARADLFRYLALYRLGGLYLDVKSGAERPFDEVVLSDDRFVLSQWRHVAGQHAGWGQHADLADVPGGEFQQWHIIAAPGHPFLRAVLNRVLHGLSHYRVRGEEVGWLGVLRLTGPITYTRAIVPLLGTAPYRRVADETALGLVYNVLGGSEHKQLFKRHYTTATAPVVRRPAPWRWWDQAYLRVRARKREWARRGEPNASR